MAPTGTAQKGSDSFDAKTTAESWSLPFVDPISEKSTQDQQSV